MIKIDLIATPKYKNTLQQYGVGALKYNGSDVNGPIQAKEIASFNSGKSYNQQVKVKSNYDKFGVRKK